MISQVLLTKALEQPRVSIYGREDRRTWRLEDYSEFELSAIPKCAHKCPS